MGLFSRLSCHLLSHGEALEIRSGLNGLASCMPRSCLVASSLIGSSSGDQTPFFDQCSVNDSRSTTRRQAKIPILWRFRSKHIKSGGYRVKKSRRNSCRDPNKHLVIGSFHMRYRPHRVRSKHAPERRRRPWISSIVAAARTCPGSSPNCSHN